VFRWPDLRHSSEVKRLCCCESYGKINPELVCCNPHHLSRLCELGKLFHAHLSFPLAGKC
jgi:Mad protein 7